MKAVCSDGSSLTTMQSVSFVCCERCFRALRHKCWRRDQTSRCFPGMNRLLLIEWPRHCTSVRTALHPCHIGATLVVCTVIANSQLGVVRAAGACRIIDEHAVSANMICQSTLTAGQN